MQAFEGIRCLDFTHVLAGPFCTYQLAVMGAEVIKIESPAQPDMMRSEGASAALNDELRGSHFLAQGANKKNLLLDIHHPQGRVVLEQLVASADVLVENFRGGVMEKLGFDYASLKEINPGLIYCSMSGFGHTGPKAHHPAYDNVIQAFSGLMAHTGSDVTGPVRVGPPVLDYGTGAQAAFAVASALFQRTRTGRGQHIDVAMLDAAIMLMSTSAVDTQITGAAPVAPGNSSITHPGYACFDTDDGQIMIGAFTARQHTDLWRALGCEDIAVEVSVLDSRAISARLEADRVVMAEVLKTRGAQHWEDLLNEAGVPAARVRQLDEALRHPQVASRRVLQQPEGYSDADSNLKSPVAAFNYEHGGPSVSHHAPPRGQHTDEILRDLGCSAEDISGWRRDGIVG